MIIERGKVIFENDTTTLNDVDFIKVEFEANLSQVIKHCSGCYFEDCTFGSGESGLSEVEQEYAGTIEGNND